MQIVFDIEPENNFNIFYERVNFPFCRSISTKIATILRRFMFSVGVAAAIIYTTHELAHIENPT